MPQYVFEVPMNFGKDVRWVYGPAEDNNWTNHMLHAQSIGRPVLLSSEWSDTDRHIPQQSPLHGRFASRGAYTGTILDYDDGTLKERIILNPDGSFAEIGVVLGEKEGIYLPVDVPDRGQIYALHDKYMPLIAHLFGIEPGKDPKRELSDTKFLVYPKGRMVISRGDWQDLGGMIRDIRGRDQHESLGRRSAWFADNKPPEGAITQKEYERFLGNSVVLV